MEAQFHDASLYANVTLVCYVVLDVCIMVDVSLLSLTCSAFFLKLVRSKIVKVVRTEKNSRSWSMAEVKNYCFINGNWSELIAWSWWMAYVTNIRPQAVGWLERTAQVSIHIPLWKEVARCTTFVTETFPRSTTYCILINVTPQTITYRNPNQDQKISNLGPGFLTLIPIPRLAAKEGYSPD